MGPHKALKLNIKILTLKIFQILSRSPNFPPASVFPYPMYEGTELVSRGWVMAVRAFAT